jgi:hypothetical protein
MIIKPLDEYGGRGVIVIEKSAMANSRSLLEFYIGFEFETNDLFSAPGNLPKKGSASPGFVKVLRFWEEHHDLLPLLVGKTSLQCYSIIEEMIGRERVTQPMYLTRSIIQPKPELNNPIYSYILSGLK